MRTSDHMISTVDDDEHIPEAQVSCPTGAECMLWSLVQPEKKIQIPSTHSRRAEGRA